MNKRKVILLLLLNFFAVYLFGNDHFSNANIESEQIFVTGAILNFQPGDSNFVDISAEPATLPAPLFINLPPIANAGADTTLVLPADMATLHGCTSFDPEMAVLRFKWVKISGPGAFFLPEDTSCSVKVKGLIEGTYSFELTVTDTAGLAAKDTIVITVNSLFSPNWPPQYVPLSNKPYKIVVIGSSTAYGTGANPIDSSWVSKFSKYLSQQNAQVSLVNLAYPGYTSYHLSPTGTVVPSNWPFVVDTLRNITRALSLNPDAIIMNLPSNDIDYGVPFSEIQFNYNRIKALADSQHVSIWITTTQPRNLGTSKQLLQMELRDWIMNRFAKNAVDFWSTLSNPDGSINSYFNAGDGIHPNNAGHHVLFTRIVEEKIWDTICIIKNIKPVAKAGKDTTINGNPAAITLDGSASYDSDGTINSYSWKIINSPFGNITGANTANPVFTTITATDYSIELELTDNLGGISKDTILISVIPPPTITYYFTGNGYWNVASNWQNNLIPPAILSGNAIVIIDPTEPGECVLNTTQKIVNGAILKIMENKKFRIEGSLEILQ